METTGQAVTAALMKYPDPRVINRFLCIHIAVLTPRQLLAYAREITPERTFETVDVSTEKLYEAGMEKIGKVRGSPRL